MERLWKAVGACAVLWTVAIALAVVGTVESKLMLMAWAVLVALAASLVAVCIAVVEERIKLETLAEIMACAAVQGAEVPRIHR